MYFFLRHLHIACAVLSVAGFVVRGGAWVLGASWPKRPLVRRVVDVNDALLLCAAVGLVLLTAQYPFKAAWVTAKLAALLIYIGLGVALFRFARLKRERVVLWCGALLSVAFIFSVAITKNPYGYFALLNT